MNIDRKLGALTKEQYEQVLEYTAILVSEALRTVIVDHGVMIGVNLQLTSLIVIEQDGKEGFHQMTGNTILGNKEMAVLPVISGTLERDVIQAIEKHRGLLNAAKLTSSMLKLGIMTDMIGNFVEKFDDFTIAAALGSSDFSPEGRKMYEVSKNFEERREAS